MPDPRKDMLGFVVSTNNPKTNKELEEQEKEIEKIVEELDEIKTVKSVNVSTRFDKRELTDIDSSKDNVKINNDMENNGVSKKEIRNLFLTIIGTVIATVLVTLFFSFKSPALVLARENTKSIEGITGSAERTIQDVRELRAELGQDIREVDEKIDRIYNLLLEIKQGE